MIFSFLEKIYSVNDGGCAAELAEYEQILREMAQDSIASQLLFLLKKYHQLEQTPLFFQEAMKNNYEQIFFQNFFIKNEMERIWAYFEKLEIETIPLKGTYFAEKFYGDLGARPTTDIDLLVHPKDVDKAVLAIGELGFVTEGERIPGHFHRSYCKELPGSPISLTVELHWDILIERTASFSIMEFWNEAMPLEDFQSIKQLSDYHTFYLICLHGWRHNLDSLKYFIDMIELIHRHRNDLDYGRLLRDAARHGTRKRIIRTLSIVYQQFPHLFKVKPFPAFKKNSTWTYHPSKGLRQYVDFIDYQFFSYDTWKHSVREAKRWGAEMVALRRQRNEG